MRPYAKIAGEMRHPIAVIEQPVKTPAALGTSDRAAAVAVAHSYSSALSKLTCLDAPGIAG
jgi:hypothetical protein